MNKPNKNDCMDFHVLKRFRQRFKVFFGQRDIDNIVNLILDSKSEPVYQLSNSKRVHIVEYNGIIFGCVYNKLRRRIHTVFPKEWIDNGSLEDHLSQRTDIIEVTTKTVKKAYTMPLNSKNKRIVRGVYD